MIPSKHKTLVAMVVEGIGLHVEDILVSLVLLIIISWTFRILAHEGDQYTVMFTIYQVNSLSNALKQTKAGPRSSGTPFLVSYKINPPVSDMLVPDPRTPKYMPLPI